MIDLIQSIVITVVALATAATARNLYRLARVLERDRWRRRL